MVHFFNASYIVIEHYIQRKLWEQIYVNDVVNLFTI